MGNKEKLPIKTIGSLTGKMGIASKKIVNKDKNSKTNQNNEQIISKSK